MNASSVAWFRTPAGVDSSSAFKYAELAGRFLLAGLFFLSGLSKLGAGYATAAGYMSAYGVPTTLLPLVILTELGAGLAVILGWHTRIASFLLAGYTLLAAAIFHSKFGDQTQFTMFLEHIAIIGGFLLLIGHGAGPLSLDHRWAANRRSSL